MTNPLCDVCRTNDAEGRLFDKGREIEWYFYCIECLENELERTRALAIAPGLAHILPPLPTPTFRPGHRTGRHTPFSGR